MATIWEETKTQSAKMKGRPLREKLEYFWEYYKTQTLIAAGVLILAISLIHAFVTSKDYALSVVIINSIADSLENVTVEWSEDLSGIIDYDPSDEEIYIDTSIMLGSATATASAEYASAQKLAALMSSQSIDVLIADTAIYEQYAQNGCFTDLRSVFDEDTLDKLSDRVYYTDAATFSDYDETDLDITVKQAGYTVDHRNPSSMKEPIPVGFFASDDTRIGQSGIYGYLTDADTYQGYPEEAIIGIVANTPRTSAAVEGVRYFISEK